MRCKRCGQDIPDGRRRLGFTVCLHCGEKEAQKEIHAKQQRVSPAYNKGGLVYQGDPETARKNLQAGVGQKIVSVIPDYKPGPIRRRTAAPARPKRRQIGVYWLGEDAYVWYEGDDLINKNVTRRARFSG